MRASGDGGGSGRRGEDDGPDASKWRSDATCTLPSRLFSVARVDKSDGLGLASRQGFGWLWNG